MQEKKWINPAFKDALSDYYYLLNKNYPEKETLKLIGDRFRLTRIQRMVLFRGITSEANVLKRKSKLIPMENSKGKILYIDGYNVLFTIMNYLLGKAIFIANDGILRDSGGTYGKIENEITFYQSVNLLMNVIPHRDLQEINIYLDCPVSNSASHINHLEKKIQLQKINGNIHLVHSADHQLKQINNGVIATSDSEIIDQAPGNIIDLARHTLETTYRISILDLGELVEQYI